MIELKPCPFCGGKARLFVGDGVRVICSKCYAGTRIQRDSVERESNSVETVVEAWNRRADKCGNAESSDSYYCRYCGAKMDGGSTDDA